MKAFREVQAAAHQAPQDKMKVPAVSVSSREAMTLNHCYTLFPLLRLLSRLCMIATVKNSNLSQVR